MLEPYSQHATWPQQTLQKTLNNVQRDWLNKSAGMLAVKYVMIQKTNLSCYIQSNSIIQQNIVFVYSNHIETKIDDSVDAAVNIFTSTTGLTPKFKVCMKMLATT